MTANKRGKVIFWIFTGIVAATGGVLLVKYLSNTSQQNKDAADAQAKADAAKAAGDPNADELQRVATAIRTTPSGFPLKLGSTDAKSKGAVSKVQQYMMDNPGPFVNGNPLPRYGVDGMFGTETQTAVKGLISPDGQVSKTWYDKNIS